MSISFENKIKDFSNVVDLLSEIELDKNSSNILARRYPVRLIFLRRFETFRLLLEKINQKNINAYHLEKKLPFNDGWITKDTLIQTLNEFSEDTVIVPFSELIRFYSRRDFDNFFNQILLIENSDQNLSRRIYLPLIGLEERFENEFFQDFTRKLESAPYWRITDDQPDSVKVFLSKKFNIKNLGDLEVIKDTSEWFKFWKRRSPCDVLCFAKPLNIYYKNPLPDKIFDIEKLDNPKELIEAVYKHPIPISFIEDEIKFWEKLSQIITEEHVSFQSIVKEYFKVKTITIKTVLDLWFRSTTDFGKWLLRHFVLSQKCLETKYVFETFKRLQDFTDQELLSQLYFCVYELSGIVEYVDDRLELIKQYSTYRAVNLCEEKEQRLLEKLKAISDPKQALLLTTGFLQFEKLFILELYLKDSTIDEDLLYKRYPEFACYCSKCYIDELSEENEWIIDYIGDYKKSKLHDNLSDSILQRISTYNKDEESFYKWYHNFESIHSIYHENKVDKVFWIDALGMEWIGFLESYLNNFKKEYKIVKKLVGVSYLPSSTDHNKFKETKYIQDFDKFIHSQRYNYPEAIINEIEKIKEIIDTHIVLDKNQTIAIVSDHGLSALSRLTDSKKYGKDDSHEGRYIEIKNEDHIPDSDYIIHKSEIDHKKYLIALKHNSLGKKPIREVHGGCTPEEVLVPYIVISNKKDYKTSNYNISISEKKISKRDLKVSFEIKPKPSIAYISVKGKSKRLVYDENSTKWIATLDKSLSGKCDIEVRVEETIKIFTIEIVSGLIEEDLF